MRDDALNGFMSFSMAWLNVRGLGSHTNPRCRSATTYGGSSREVVSVGHPRALAYVEMQVFFALHSRSVVLESQIGAARVWSLLKAARPTDSMTPTGRLSSRVERNGRARNPYPSSWTDLVTVSTGSFQRCGTQSDFSHRSRT